MTGRAPNLRVLGDIQPGEQELVVLAESKENNVPSAQILAIEVQFGLRNAVKKVPGFLACFPNLETLHVQSRRICEESTGKVNLRFWQEGGPIKCVMESMKKVFFYEFRGSRSEVAFLKFVAERARVLEKIVVVVTSECFSSGGDNGESTVHSHKLASDFDFADPFDLKYYSTGQMIYVI